MLAKGGCRQDRTASSAAQLRVQRSNTVCRQQASQPARPLTDAQGQALFLGSRQATATSRCPCRVRQTTAKCKPAAGAEAKLSSGQRAGKVGPLVKQLAPTCALNFCSTRQLLPHLASCLYLAMAGPSSGSALDRDCVQTRARGSRRGAKYRGGLLLAPLFDTTPPQRVAQAPDTAASRVQLSALLLWAGPYPPPPTSGCDVPMNEKHSGRNSMHAPAACAACARTQTKKY